MAEKSKIEWTDATWNPITGCSLVSEGCRNCYAAGLAATRLKNHPSRVGLARKNADGVAKFTGEVRFNEQWLDQPLHWRRGRKIFVCAHGDLFHESVPFEWIDRIFAVMALCQQHTFQVLTKRPERMREYMSAFDKYSIIEMDEWRAASYRVTCDDAPNGSAAWHEETGRLEASMGVALRALRDKNPLPNLWLGVSVEDQTTADEHIPLLLDTPAAKRFISAEPLLGAIKNIWQWLNPNRNCERCGASDAAAGECCFVEHPCLNRAAVLDAHMNPVCLDWIIVGGESGPNARPMHVDWVRSLRDQCAAAGVSFFFKQWGEYLPVGQSLPGYGKVHGATAVKPGGRLKLHYGGTSQQKPEHAFAKRGVEFASMLDGSLTFRVGKKAAGHLLDGREHSEFPA